MIKLHLGCGIRKFPGWKHFDIGDYEHLDGHDIINLPYPDNSVDLIYSSHTLEYFDRNEIIEVLNKWYKILKPGGIIRLAVPNFEAMVKLYYLEMMPIETFLGPLYGKMQPSGHEIIYHKTAYDFRSLRILLESIGFVDIQLYDWKQTEHGHIDDHSHAYLPHMDFDKGILISLNVEGIKK